MFGHIAVVKLIFLLLTIHYVDSTYLISVSDDKITNQSESVILSCKAYNNLTAQMYSVAWRRSGVVITERKLIHSENLKQFVGENELYRYTIQGLPISTDITDYRLEIRDLKKDDIGDYACSLCKRFVSSYACIEPLEIAENLPVSLDVMYTPKQPICSILEKSSLGADITVECVSGEGKPRIDLKFTIDGEFLDRDLATTPTASDEGMLRIRRSFKVTEDNIGKEIGCNSTSPYFTNFIGSCKHGTITVQDTPELTLKSSPSRAISIGDSVTYTCSAKSRSDIKYFDWTSDSKYIKDRMIITTDLSGKTSTMLLHEISSSDDKALINCSVENKAGEIKVVSVVLAIANNLIPSTAAHLETTGIPSNKTTGELGSIDESNIGIIAGIVLTVVVLISISGIAGYLLFVRRRKLYQKHIPVPLDETSSTIKSDNVWSEKEDDNQTEKYKIRPDDNLNDCEQNANKEFTEETQELNYESGEKLISDDNNYVGHDHDDEEDDVFIGVTEILPVPTHV